MQVRGIDAMRRRLGSLWLLLFLIMIFPEPVPAAVRPPLHVILSIDTETSAGCGPNGCMPAPIEELILGLHGGRYYGIDLMMDMLEQHGMRGTFFVNAYLDAAYPDAEIQNFVHRIVARGHDVQLHTHAEFRCLRLCPGRDSACWKQCTRHESFLVGNSYQAQLAIIREGAKNIERWTGSYPIAYRGGGFGADETTLRVLRDLGIRFDSSLHTAGSPLGELYPRNRVTERDGVVEIPLYSFRDDLVVERREKFADMENLSLPELKELVRMAEQRDMRTAVFIMHSFSFCRERGPCPNRKVIRNFGDFLSFLRAERGVRVITLKDLARDYDQHPSDFVGSGGIPTNPYWMVLYRSFDLFGDSSNNRRFAMANAAAALLLTLLAIGVLYRRRRGRKPALP